MQIKIKLLRENAVAPKRETNGSAGYDLCACIDKPVTILPMQTEKIGTGFALALETGYAAFIYARSGLGIKLGIVPANCVGVVDSDYRGEVVVGLKNLSDTAYTVNPDDKVAQMVISKCEIGDIILCDELDETERGAHGFGSTGK